MRIEANGVGISCRLEGPEAAPVVIFSHSLATHGGMWQPQAEALRDRFRVLRYDTRGHGGSAVAPVASFDVLADDVVALASGLGVDAFHFVGLSMGGMIGQSLALRHAGRLTSLTLCDTMARAPAEADKMFAERVRMAREQGMAALVEPTLQRWFTAGYLGRNPPGLAAVRKMIRETPVEGFGAICGVIPRLDYLDRLSAIATPTLIVVGAQDPGTPVAASEAMQARIDGARLAVIEKASHLSNWEQPAEFNRLVSGFLDSL